MEGWHFGLGCVAESRTGSVFQLTFDGQSEASALVCMQQSSESSAVMQVIFREPIESFGEIPIEWLCGHLSLMCREQTGFLANQIRLYSAIAHSPDVRPRNLWLRIARSSMDESYCLIVKGVSFTDYDKGELIEDNYIPMATLICIDDINPHAVGLILEDPTLTDAENRTQFRNWLFDSLKIEPDTQIVFEVSARLIATLEPN
jgi:hypothetical protein